MFRFNRKTEYGLIAIQYMSLLPQNRVATVKEISEKHQIPQYLLAKILQQLGKRHIVRSVQGARGGYVLTEKAGIASLADVVEALEGPIRVTDCRTDRPCCDRIKVCELKENFEPLQQKIEGIFKTISLREFLNSTMSNINT